MEDIDRTFLKLKRIPLADAIKKLQAEGKFSVVVNPLTFVPVARVKIEDLLSTGWTIHDVTDQIESKIGYKVVLDGDWADIEFNG